MLTKMYCKVSAFLTEFKNDERGVTAIEYGLIAAAMAAALTVYFGSGGSIGTKLTAIFQSINSAL